MRNEAKSASVLPLPPLRIALLTPAWPGKSTANGIATAVAHLAAGLQAIGQDVTILANSVDGPHNHPRVVLLPKLERSLVERVLGRIAPDRAQRHIAVRRILAAARRAIADHGIEIVMIEETHGWAGEVRRKLPVPVVVTLHGPWWLHRHTPGVPDGRIGARREAREAKGLRQVDAIIAPSQNVRDRTDAEWGLPDLPCAIIGNPVSFDEESTLASSVPEPNLLFVGRFDRIKGGDLVIEAFRRLAERHPTCTLTFVGPDIGIPQPDGTVLRLSHLHRTLPEPLRSRISILGIRTREEIAELRRRFPITLIASRYETFGVALIEAMVAGSAVVATDVGGCSEIVRDGETGLLVQPEDPEALAAACLRLLSDRALAQRLGEAARLDIRSRFAPEVIARQVTAFLAPLCRK